MEDDIFSDLTVVSAKKTYKSKKASSLFSTNYNKQSEDVEIPQPLTTKAAVKFLLEGRLKSRVCRYCLNITSALSELDQIMKIGGTGNIYKVTIKDIVASFHPFKVAEDPNFPDKICQKCLDRALGAYLFTQQCERAERAMLNCFDDMYEKLEKLDPIDRPKKRGRQKQNPNYNILHAEHERVIDYAEPIINIINLGAETYTKEPELNELECKKCWQLLPNIESLLNHEKIHPKTMWYHCRLCGKSFPKRNQLKKHNHRAHVLGKEVHPQIDKNFKCNECDHVTETFIQHLQHIEKHKFRNVMEHLIEKKMDSLCVVCFSKASNMNDLDKMVCIHGGHPDLMGDKTLYHVLASTLPNPSYKYQELYLPSKAQIMTISKRPYSYGDRSIGEVNSKENFVFSNPVVVTKNRFKTDHFYFYVFCDPENHINTYINVNEIDKPRATNTKLVEVVKIEEIKNEIVNTAKIYPSSTKDVEMKSMDAKEIKDAYAIWATRTAIDKKLASEELQTVITKRAKITEETNKEIYSCVEENRNRKLPYIFTDPELVYSQYKRTERTSDDERIEANSKLSKYEFPKPVYIKALGGKESNADGMETAQLNNIKQHTRSKFDEEVIQCDNEKRIFGTEKTAMTRDDKRLAEDLCDKCWVFKNTNHVCKADDNVTIGLPKDNTTKKATECKFCWVFKHTDKCDYCKKPIANLKKPKDVPVDKEYNNNIKNAFNANKIKEMWQCSICLTNNNQYRMTCICCSTIKITEFTDIKIPFQNNNVFFQAKDEENNNVIETVTSDRDLNTINEKYEPEKVNFFEESTVMDYISFSDEVAEATISDMQSMDVETNASFNIKDIEEMDVEENPITASKGLDWTEAPVFKLHIDNMNNNVGVNTPIIGATLKFNIGCTNEPKSMPRKIKKILRNIPKASHK